MNNISTPVGQTFLKPDAFLTLTNQSIIAAIMARNCRVGILAALIQHLIALRMVLTTFLEKEAYWLTSIALLYSERLEQNFL